MSSCLSAKAIARLTGVFAERMPVKANNPIYARHGDGGASRQQPLVRVKGVGGIDIRLQGRCTEGGLWGAMRFIIHQTPVLRTAHEIAGRGNMAPAGRTIQMIPVLPEWCELRRGEGVA